MKTRADIARENRQKGNLDPTAGVILWPKVERCPRCDCEKGERGKVRRGLCRDCSTVVGPEYRSAWAA